MPVSAIISNYYNFTAKIPILTLNVNTSGLEKYMLKAKMSKVVYPLGECGSVTCESTT